MREKVGIVTVAYGSPVGITGLVTSARKCDWRTNLEFYLFVHSRDSATMLSCQELVSLGGIFYFPYQSNRGLSKSWNDGVLMAYGNGCDVVIIANDDIEFSDGDVAKIAEFAMNHREYYMVSVAGHHVGYKKNVPSLGHSCFVYNPIAVEKIGMFDENIFPAYMEDCDISRRAHLAGLHETNCPDTMVYHVGSHAINESGLLNEQNGKTHSLNMEYYKRKWGGENGKEVYMTPFNDPKFDARIAPEIRHSPYPGYNRSDQRIVVF